MTADSGFPAADRIDAAEQYGFAGLQFEDDGCFRRAIALRFQRCTLDAFAQPAGVVRLDGRAGFGERLPKPVGTIGVGADHASRPSVVSSQLAGPVRIRWTALSRA